MSAGQQLDENTMLRGGIDFFSRISASISHEIKNVLAIINENAGLLDDLVSMAEAGYPLDPNKLRRVAEKIQFQIQRADVIIRNMNTFAHSNDVFIKKTDLVELVELTLAITGRLVSKHAITVNFNKPSLPYPCETAPFFLMTVIWSCLEFCLEACGEKKTLEVTVHLAGEAYALTISGLKMAGERSLTSFPSPALTSSLASLKIKLLLDEPDGQLNLTIPAVSLI